MLQPLEQQVIQLISLVEAGQFLEAIRRFYADDAILQENDGPSRSGMEAILAGERKALASFKEMHVIRAESFVADSDRAAVNWLFEYTDAHGRHRLNEIAYQQWRDGKIVRERFYYDPAQRLIEVSAGEEEAAEPIAAGVAHGRDGRK